MRLITTTILSASIAASALAAEAPALSTEKDKISYGIGMNVGSNIRRHDIDVDVNMILQGLKDAIAGDQVLMTQEELGATMTALQQQIMKRQEEVRAQTSEKNRALGEAFLAENAKAEGVKVLENGIQYRVIYEGVGSSPTIEDNVKIHYKASFVDGREFGNTHTAGQPQTVALRSMSIPKGWPEVLQLMKEGAKWEVVLPADLAYGDAGQPPIEPGSTLRFEIELLEVIRPAPRRSEPVISQEIIRVPSAEERARGAQPEIIRAEDIERYKQQQQQQQQQTPPQE